MTAPHPQNVRLEVCIASLQGAIIAESGGADRLELNAALPLGGLTPSLGLLRAVKESYGHGRHGDFKSPCGLPVIVMVRPRPGGFCYEEADWRVMQREIDLLLQHGAEGIAFGVLTERGEIDIPRCRMVLRQAAGRETVFHRAFDLTPDPFRAMEQLIDLGVTRILTSGQAATAAQGAEVIRRLREQAGERIEILPGGGIRAHNVRQLLAATGCDQVHAAPRKTYRDVSNVARPELRFGAGANLVEGEYEETDEGAVKALRAAMG